MDVLKKLNIIGAGRVGQALGFLWQSHHFFEIGAVLNRSHDRAQSAVTFIQAGKPFDFSSMHVLPAADVWLLTCPDDELKHVCDQLVQAAFIRASSIVLHCSGALTAQEVLGNAKNIGAHIASIHPIKSFANPAQAILDFKGTYCGVEGDVEALNVLIPAFEAIGAQCFPIKSQAKTLYHAASVIACNYLVALQEISIQTFEQAGIERTQAMGILQPIVEGTVANIFKLGTQAALTGPIARGDVAVVERQLSAIRDWRADYGAVYQQLGRVALGLARQNRTVSNEDFVKLERVLSS